MYAISLTSIPSRFDRLTPVLRALLAQRPAPVRVILCLPRRYARFPGPVTPPPLPEGVELLRHESDLGPATKALPAARRLAGQVGRMIWCDDDWIMGPGWASALLDEAAAREATTGQGYGVARLRRRGSAPTPAHVEIAQGFAGVCADPAWLSGPDMDPPPTAWPVDDIWLSGQLARQGIAIRTVPAARRAMRLAHGDGPALQDSAIGGRSRHGANIACLDELTARYGIWPAQG
ncbi:hypothetical protein [Roseovarius pacificus]|uniref:hypothetical protein n=1 Tax=Roseovarius pacificus TaxID=337701 RepID=UPI0040391043